MINLMMMNTGARHIILFAYTSSDDNIRFVQDVENSNGRHCKNTTRVIAIYDRHDTGEEATGERSARTLGLTAWNTRRARMYGSWIRRYARASGGGNGQDRLGMLSGPVCLFFIFLSIPRRRRRRRRCTRAYRHPAPDRPRRRSVCRRWNAPVRVVQPPLHAGDFFCAWPRRRRV
jgi:hypothetical protein